MRIHLLACALALALGLPAAVRAQIYTCTAPDGTRVFSDERCGPDAKVVKGIETRKKRPAAAKSDSSTAKAPPKSDLELQMLSAQCDRGDTRACNEWTRSGGPASLRANERKLEQACDGGQLAACEERYCRDGATKECRARVQQTAPASGPHWYLRSTPQRQADGVTAYAVRCMQEGDLAMQDVTLSCAATAGPQRCRAADGPQAAATMSAAASQRCGMSR
ncbi:MAG: DUF4124 domain-containing protein [Steroidobacteraceae bacterium]